MNYTTGFESWPLAMSYVPYHAWEALYEESLALSRGTAFPSLYKPFSGSEVCR